MTVSKIHDLEALRKEAVQLLSEAISQAELAAHPMNYGTGKRVIDAHAEALAAINALYVAGNDLDECGTAAIRTLQVFDCTWAGPGATHWSVPTGTFAEMRLLVQGSKEQPDESLTASVHRAGKRVCSSLGGDPTSKAGQTWANGWMSAYLVFGGSDTDDGGEAA